MPSIFSRFADIISSNLNSMLDKAENPAKMIKLIIVEMEDTLVEIKVACAQAMADQARLNRRLPEVKEAALLWQKRAETAVAKGRDDLAREALLEKNQQDKVLAESEKQTAELALVVEKYRTEIEQLEGKLAQARERQQLLSHRTQRAQKSLAVSDQIKRYDLTESQLKLERLDNRLDKLEAEAAIEFEGRRRPESESREKAFAELDDSLEEELRALKERLNN